MYPWGSISTTLRTTALNTVHEEHELKVLYINEILRSKHRMLKLVFEIPYSSAFVNTSRHKPSASLTEERLNCSMAMSGNAVLVNAAHPCEAVPQKLNAVFRKIITAKFRIGEYQRLCRLGGLWKQHLLHLWRSAW